MSILDSIELFSTLAIGDRDTLALYCQERVLISGETLFEEWDDATVVYIVKSGSLKAYKDRSDGQKTLGYIRSNELAGEMAIFDPDAPKRRTASVRAIDDAILIVIMDYAILELSKKHQSIYQKILHIMLERKKSS